MLVSNTELDDLLIMKKLYSLIPHKSILELGVFDGRTSKHFMEWSDDVTLVENFAYHTKLNISEPEKKLKKLGFEVVDKVPDRKYGFIMWDVGETYEDGYHFDKYLPYLEKNGIFVIDDMFNMTFDVMTGVVDKLRKLDFYICFATNKKVFITKSIDTHNKINNNCEKDRKNWPRGYYRVNNFANFSFYSYMGKWTDSFPERAKVLDGS